MREHNETLSKGLNLMYWGNIIVIVSSLLTILVIALPILAVLLLLVIIGAGVANLVGLYQIHNEHPDYQTAMILWVIGFLVSLVGNFIRDESAFSVVLSSVQGILDLYALYLIIRATNSFLAARGSDELVAKGHKTWQWNLWTTVATLVCAVLSALLLAGESKLVGLSLAVTLITAIFSIAATLMYVGYLGKSAEAV